jgi:hypothetical protein
MTGLYAWDMNPRRSTILRASAIYIVLWTPALLIAALTSLVGLVTFRSAPMWSALSFLLALPAVLIGLRSFRVSAMTIVALLAWDIVTTTWPRVNLNGMLHSLIDVQLLAVMVLVVLVALLSHFGSLSSFLHDLRGV